VACNHTTTERLANEDSRMFLGDTWKIKDGNLSLQTRFYTDIAEAYRELRADNKDFQATEKRISTQAFNTDNRYGDW